ncbi:MAG: P-II family nitrogen regulator [Clostridia bacterium]|jgi:nitrogen regulatory protein PII|nr:P-II family nitrogen regulator [Clostridia bacterium]
MEKTPNNYELELVCVIVNFGIGSKILKTAKQCGVTGGTILLGTGTIKNRLLEFLDLYEVRKEIVLMIAEKTVADKALVELNRKFNFDKPNHGIAFSMPVKNAYGLTSFQENQLKESRGVENTMNKYNIIFTVVDRGKAESVIEAANEAGSRGGTIINARGSGIHETSKLFAMDIEPEKEVVLIISEENLTQKIASSIREKMKIDEPGNGIIFIQDVNQAYGLYVN